MKIQLVSHTNEPEKTITAAAKLCYSSLTIDKLIEKQDAASIEKFINLLINIGHQSPLEHASFTFAIEGVSRSLTHQLVRHRIASYSQKSQRYVKEGQFDYIIPIEIQKDEELLEIFNNHMVEIQKIYDVLSDGLKKKYVFNGMNEKQAEKKAIENARAVLPNACETKIFVTMNLRTLINFTRHRNCSRAQDEIREMSKELTKIVEEKFPLLGRMLGAPCQFGKCPEGVMCCGNPLPKKK